MSHALLLQNACAIIRQYFFPYTILAIFVLLRTTSISPAEAGADRVRRPLAAARRTLHAAADPLVRAKIRREHERSAESGSGAAIRASTISSHARCARMRARWPTRFRLPGGRGDQPVRRHRARQIIQAKGHRYSTTALVGGEHAGGAIRTRQLRHAVPQSARLPSHSHAVRRQATRMIYVPGALFSVNPTRRAACRDCSPAMSAWYACSNRRSVRSCWSWSAPHRRQHGDRVARRGESAARR